jgi:hypothetical protein
MSRQLQAGKELLIFGDSNVERNLSGTGRLYCSQTDSVPARNLTEFHQALSQLPPNKYRIVIFAMMTNIVISAGNSVSANNNYDRIKTIETCVKKIIRTIT